MATRPPYEYKQYEDEYLYEETGDQSAWMNVSLPSFRDNTKYLPLSEALEGERIKAEILYDMVLRDALEDAEVDSVFASLTRWVDVDSAVHMNGDIVTVFVRCEYYSGSISETHGYTMCYTYNVKTHELIVDELDEH